MALCLAPGGTKTIQDFPLFIDGQGTTNGLLVSVSPGTHVVSETNQPNYSASFSGECDAQGNVTVALGQIKQCIITNNDEIIPSISGVKFEDKNANGIRDLGEPGLGGWTIYLDSNNNGVKNIGERSVVMSANGRYEFSNLSPGTYRVREEMQTGWKRSFPGGGVHVVTLVPGQGVNGKNFGNYQRGKISGVKFNDLNNNGQKDLGEPLKNGWVITLKKNGQVVGTKTTANGGKYQFANLEPGLYEVSETLKAGWKQTYPGGSGIHQIEVSSGQTISNVDFGNFKYGVIRGVKYEDANSSGTKDILESGLLGWNIILVNTSNGFQESRTTGAGGAYEFGNLLPGNYLLREELKGGWLATAPPGGLYPQFSISSSGQEITKNFGNKKLPTFP